MIKHNFPEAVQKGGTKKAPQGSTVLPGSSNPPLVIGVSVPGQSGMISVADLGKRR